MAGFDSCVSFAWRIASTAFSPSAEACVEAHHELARGLVFHRPEAHGDGASTGEEKGLGQPDEALAAYLPAERGLAAGEDDQIRRRG